MFDGAWAEFSPNGRYLAYQSAEGEPGRSEVYVRPFPRVDSGRWQISTAGGTRPAWARSGREAVLPRRIEYAHRGAGPDIRVDVQRGKPAKVFDAKYSSQLPPASYDVSPRRQRFLMLKHSGAGDPNATPVSMVVVEHWFEELKQRVNGK